MGPLAVSPPGAGRAPAPEQLQQEARAEDPAAAGHAQAQGIADDPNPCASAGSAGKVAPAVPPPLPAHNRAKGVKHTHIEVPAVLRLVSLEVAVFCT